MKVWHRRCFLCSQCSKQLYRGSYRVVEPGKYECVEHFSNKILGRSSAITNGSASPKSITAKVEGLNPFAEDDESFKRALTTPNQPVKLRVPPPRPPPPSSSRATAIIQKQLQEQQGETKEVKPEKPIPPARAINNSNPPSENKVDISDYPGFLNPFGSEDEDDSESSESDYDDNLNPFADDGEQEKKPPEPKPSPTPSNDRPTSQPPAPPKPPRASLLQQSQNNDAANKVTTLPRAKKTYRAPPPPIPIKRKIEFTEHKSYETVDQILEELRLLQKSHEKLETQGKGLEHEILFALEKGLVLNEFIYEYMFSDGLEWKKNKKVEEWINLIEQKYSTIRREAVLIHV